MTMVDEPKMKLLVVCHANVNRSPLAAALLSQAATGAQILQAALKDIPRPERAAKKIRDVASQLGLDLSDHRSQQATPEMLADADMVIYMDGGNLKRLKALAGVERASMRWHCLAEFSATSATRIPDPAFQRRGSQEFFDTIELISEASRNLANVIAEVCKERQGEAEGADE